MGLISPAQVSDGTTADASDINNPINTIANEFNGNIDNNNIKASAGIATSKIASGVLAVPYKFHAYSSGATTLAASGFTKVTLAAESFDTGSNFNTTNSNFTAPVNGFYFFAGAVNVTATTGDTYIAELFKGGSEFFRGSQVNAVSSVVSVVVTAFVQLAAGDIIDLRCFNGAAATKQTNFGTAPYETYLTGFLVST